MIDWIKFSERQPEKEGEYLCYFADGAGWHQYIDDFLILSWSEKEKHFWDMEDNCEHIGSLNPPDYWAEINPPLVRRLGYRMIPGTKGLTMAEFFELQQKRQEEWTEKDRIKKEASMPEKPLCKDCKWIGGEIHINSHAKCQSPQAPHSLVDDLGFCLCRDLRQSVFPSTPGYRSEFTASEAARLIDIGSETCGPEGRWFEAKEATPKRPVITLRFTSEERAYYLDILDKMRRWFL